MTSDERAALAADIHRASRITGDFLLRSGARSTEYFDKYRFEADPTLLARIAEAMVALLPGGDEGAGAAPAYDALAGLELGGVPIATALSARTGIPARFVRKEAKTYGTCQLAEGGELTGLRLVVVEDVVTSGGQVVESCRELRQLGAEVVRVVCVIDREAGGVENLRAEGLDLHALFTMSELQAAASGSPR